MINIGNPSNPAMPSLVPYSEAIAGSKLSDARGDEEAP